MEVPETTKDTTVDWLNLNNSLIMLFDVGGTLLDSSDFFTEITNKLTGNMVDQKTHDLVIRTFTHIMRNLDRYLSIEGILANTLKSIAQEYNYPDISYQAHDIYYNTFLYQSSLFPETPSVLDILYRNDVKMIIASDGEPELMEQWLINHNLKKYFIDVCTSGIVGAYKPSDEYINYLRKYTLNNEANCYFVGDNRQDIVCGKKLGITSVLIDRTDSKEPMDADYVIHDLNELLGIMKLGH